MRLKIKNQERLEGVKQREMQLEDMVGVYTRINMVKGSLNYNGKPRPRYVKSRGFTIWAVIVILMITDFKGDIGFES